MCAESSLVYSIYCGSTIDKEFQKRTVDGLTIGNERVWSLAYADDMIVVTKNREALVDMLDTFRRFLKGRGLELNTDKSKVLIFYKSRREKKKSWLWKGSKIEEVKIFKYLGFIFNWKGTYKDNLKEMRNKGKLTANKNWGLGERVCREEFKKKRTLFVYLVKSIMEYCDVSNL